MRPLMRTVSCVGAFLAVGAGATATGEVLPGVRGTVWVTNRTTNDVTAFAAATGEVVARVKVGTTPIGVTAPPGRGKVYVSDEGSNTVSVISRWDLSVRTIATGPRPHHVCHGPDGRRVYAAEFGANSVAVIDTATDTLVGRWVTGPSTARTHACAVTTDGRTLLVTNSVVNEIAALDARTGAMKWTLAVGRNPSEVLPSATGRFAYVTARADHALQVVDLDVPAVVAQVHVGTEPDTINLSSDGQHLVIGLRGTPASAALVDLRDLAVSWVALPGTLAGHNALTPDGRHAFVAVEGTAPGVAVVDTQSGTVVRFDAYPGGGRPHGVMHEF